MEFNKKHMGLLDYDDAKAQLGKLFYTNLTSICNDVHHHDQPNWKRPCLRVWVSSPKVSDSPT
jgi:hypothetical protein